MFKLTTAMILCMLAGCASTPPGATDSVCSTQPGAYACQIERYQNADG